MTTAIVTICVLMLCAILFAGGYYLGFDDGSRERSKYHLQEIRGLKHKIAWLESENRRIRTFDESVEEFYRGQKND